MAILVNVATVHMVHYKFEVAVKVLNFVTPKIFAVIPLKVEQKGLSIYCPKVADGMTNNVDLVRLLGAVFLAV